MYNGYMECKDGSPSYAIGRNSGMPEFPDVPRTCLHLRGFVYTRTTVLHFSLAEIRRRREALRRDLDA